MRAEFKSTFSELLRKRLHPNTALHVEQLAYAIGYEPATVRNWLRSSNEPSGAAVMACCNFFAARADIEPMILLCPNIEPLLRRNKRAEEALTFVEGLAKFAQGASAA